MFVCIQLRRNQFSLILELTSYDTHFLAIAIFQISKHQNSTAYKTTTSTTSKYSTIPIHKPNTIKNPSHILFDYPFILSSRFTSIYSIKIFLCVFSYPQISSTRSPPGYGFQYAINFQEESIRCSGPFRRIRLTRSTRTATPFKCLS